MLTWLGVIFCGAALAPLVVHRLRRFAGWVLALLPLAALAYFLSLTPAITRGEVFHEHLPWVPSLQVNLSLRLDGFSWLMALLISGIGVLIVIYAGGYMAGRPQMGRFFAFLFLFMGAMLGVVLADNLLLLFVFWEMTSLSSYLLIGFKHESDKAQKSALQALLVTGSGGLALLVGLILLAAPTGSWTLTALLAQGRAVQSAPLFPLALGLILLGALTKSAQFPFHFWLPNAMAGPTPVSAYLHSATMVKAGVYLLARLAPLAGDHPLWLGVLPLLGALTALIGAWLAWQQSDLKRILAYTTISALGFLVWLLGLGSELALKTAVLFLLTHALYKGALFMAAGAVDHATGTLDIRQLRGLWRVLPWTGIGMGLAALSQAGLPPLVGFLAKEYIYETTLAATDGGAWTAAAVTANVFMVTTAILVVRPFWGRRPVAPHSPHAAPVSLWLGPLVLGGASLGVGLAAEVLSPIVFTPAVSVLVDEPLTVELSLLTALSKLSPMLLLSLATLALGSAFYLVRVPAETWAQALDRRLAPLGPAHWYEYGLEGSLVLGQVLTNRLQRGHIRVYLLWIFTFMVALVGYGLLSQGFVWQPWASVGLRLHEVATAILVLVATGLALQTPSRLSAVAALGVVGYGVALTFVWFGAPDLAMTQFAVETLTVMVLVLVLYRLPRFSRFSSRAGRLRDALIAGAVGVVMGSFALAAAVPAARHVSDYFVANSLLLARGRNIVNVILVDFRGLDTLGEITVLATAAMGVYALLKRRSTTGRDDDAVSAVGKPQLRTGQGRSTTGGDDA